MTEKNQTWKITLLTPLHIGDGSELQKDVDYLTEKNSLRVIDPETVFSQMADNPGVLMEAGQAGFNLARLIGDYRLSVKETYNLPVVGGKPPLSLRRFIKDAFGRPFLPGSTLKGSLRTALWTQLDRSRVPAVERFREFERGIRDVSGSSPHFDFLRPLQVSDGSGIDPEGALVAQEVKFFNLRGETGAGWKSFEGRGNPTQERHQDAVGIFVEALRPNTQFIVRTGIDSFFETDAARSALHLPNSEGLDHHGRFARAINEHSLRIARREYEFFSRFGGDTAAITGFYRQVVEGIQSLLPDKPTFITRMAWGSGWRGMTGDWLSDRELEVVRRERRLGKNGVPVFPKTRRLAMANGVPSLPMGWVVVAPEKEEAFTRISRIPEWVFRDVGKTGLENPADSASPTEAKESPSGGSEPQSKANTETQEAGSAEKESTPAAKAETEEWPEAVLSYSPSDGRIIATAQHTEQKGKKAETRDKSRIPESLHNQLFNRRRTLKKTVRVLPYGRSFELVTVNE